MTQTDEKHLLKPGEVAERLNVSLQTLWRWRKQKNQGPAFTKLSDKTVRYLPLKITVENE